MTDIVDTQRHPLLVRFDTFTEMQQEIAKRIAVAEDCYRTNKGTGEDHAALVAFGRVQELRGLVEVLARMAGQG